MAFHDLRAFLAALQVERELLVIDQPVDPRYEYCALLAELDRRQGPALRATNIPGKAATLAGNTLGTRRRLAMGLETSVEAFADEYLRRKGQLVPPAVVDGGVAQEVVVDAGIDVLGVLPVPTFHERDASPYFTAAVATARSPVSSLQSMGIHRVQVKGPDRLGIYLATPPLSTFLAEAEERGQPLPIALCIGLDPGLLFSSVVFVPGADRFAVAGGVRGEPVSLTRARTTDLNIIADAEVVIEGEILPGVREPEGPFGETTGYYFSNPSVVMRITAITHRRQPILYAVHPKSSEVFNLLAPGREADLRAELRGLGLGVGQVHITAESCGLEVVVSVAKRYRTEARTIILRVLAENPFFKCVTVVDDDVDVFDARDVAWAAATRCQPDRDLMIMPGLRGTGIDPSARHDEVEGPITSKLGIDATSSQAAGGFERMRVPPAALEKARRLLGDGS